MPQESFFEFSPKFLSVKIVFYGSADGCKFFGQEVFFSYILAGCGSLQCRIEEQVKDIMVVVGVGLGKSDMSGRLCETLRNIRRRFFFKSKRKADGASFAQAHFEAVFVFVVRIKTSFQIPDRFFRHMPWKAGSPEIFSSVYSVR